MNIHKAKRHLQRAHELLNFGNTSFGNVERMCDKTSDFNCWKNWEEMGEESEKDCLDTYCSGTIPDEYKTKECMEDSGGVYQKYALNTFPPKGWEQLSSDCWIDTALYSLFGSNEIASVMSAILDDMHETRDHYLGSDFSAWNDLAKSISNFLKGIDNDKFTSDNEGICKTKWKKKVTDAVINIIYNDPKEGQGFRDLGKEAVKANVMTEGKGVMWPLYKVFSMFAPRKIRYEKLDLYMCDENHPQKRFLCDNWKQSKFIKNITQTTLHDKANMPLFQRIASFFSGSPSNVTVCIVHVAFPGGDSQTQITDIKEFRIGTSNYKLNSISFGEGIHYHTIITSGNIWGWYNDSGGTGRKGRPSTRTGLLTKDEINNTTFKHADEIVAIYVRDS